MLINDHFQNFKVYQIPKAQLIIADVPYNLGNNAYASNPGWYKDGDKLPKFRNNGKMVFNCMDWIRDNESEKIHPTQKPVKMLMRLIEIFTDPGDVVIDPVAGSGSTLIAAMELGRKAYGFEIKKNFFKYAQSWIEQEKTKKKELKEIGFAKTMISKNHATLF